MTKPTNTQSQKRFNESLASLFLQEEDKASHLFIKSSSDVGVIRNGGRNGARFAPKSFLAFFKRLAIDLDLSKVKFKEFEVSDTTLEEKDFDLAQKQESKAIKEILQNNPDSAVIHIGGGHDHIYPLLKAYSHLKKITVINIDAHADTRTDENFHSGTPFRQFSQDFIGEFQIYQVGLHPFANSESTLTPLVKGKSAILWKNELQLPDRVKMFFAEIKKEISQDSLVIFSLDADALKGEMVPGVSAVNGDGISIDQLKDLWDEYLKMCPHQTILGIYELNPLYDSLSGLSMRSLSSFVFHTLKK